VSRSRFRAAAAALVLVAAVLRFWALDVGLPHLMARPDDEAVLVMTEKPARGQWDVGWAVYPSAYVYLCWLWGAAGARVGQAVGAVPAGSYLELLYAHPDRLLLLDRVLSATLGTATVAVVAAVARPALGEPAALAAAALLATAFLHVRDSHSLKPDVALAFLAVVALGAMAPLWRRATARAAAGAGAAVGLATAMKYPGVLLLAPLALAAGVGGAARGRPRLRVGPLAAGLAAAAAVFVATSPFLLVNAGTRAFLGYLVHLAIGAPPAAPATPSPPPALLYHATVSLPWGIGLLATVLAPVAIGWAFVDRRPLLVVAAVFVLVWFAVMGMATQRLSRYVTPLVPALALVEGAAVAAAAARLAPRRAALVATLATAALVAQPLAASVAHDRIAARTDTRVLATRWMAAHLPPGSRVAVLGTRYWIWGVPQFPPGIAGVTPDDPSPAGLAAAHVDHVLTHDHAVFASRLDPAVMAALAPHLRPLADFDPFVPGRGGAVFELDDAYYVPIGRFGAVARPGPHIRIFAFEGR